MEVDDGQVVAIDAYRQKLGRIFVPQPIPVSIPLDALMFSEYQKPWGATLEEYKEKRCRYDRETNEWLVWYVTHFMLDPKIPPIYVDITPTGVALVDGTHRVTARLIQGHQNILAYLNDN